MKNRSGKDTYNAANASFEAGKHEEALAQFQKAIDAGGLSAEELSQSRYNLAILYFMSKRFDEAMAEVNQVIAVQPENIPAIGLRASIWIALGSSKGEDTGAQALADWARILKIDPTDANTYNDRGLYYADRGESEKAIDDLEKFLVLEPDNPDQKDFLEELKTNLAKKNKEPKAAQ